MTDTILLTGATGFLGTELSERLIRLPQVRVYALVRAADEAEGYHRLRAAWHHNPPLRDAVGRQVIPVCGDFTKTRLGLTEADVQALREQVTLVIHAGAEIGFQKSREELENTNVRGTENLLFFAAGFSKLRRFVHISTAYVAGQGRGIIPEEAPVGTAFSSYYEQSKAEAEGLVRASGLPFSICRPGMIVGDSRDGWVKNFNTIYYVLKLMLLGKLPVLPVSPDMPLNLVNVDYVADCVVEIARSREAVGKTFHLTCPRAAAPKAGELAAFVRGWAKRNLSLSLPNPLFMPLPALKRAGLAHNRREAGRKKSTTSNLLTLMPYFFAQQEFDRRNTDILCGPYPLRWRDSMEKLLSFACRKNFMRQTGQTVFQQARVRRESRRYPVCYYDVTSSGIIRVPGPEVNRRMDAIMDALWGWGVRKGDRVALTGINSVDYLALEQAIGLLGAVSVPIYYTTPAAETAVLLEKSGAAWFFIGDKRMMEQIGTVDTRAKLVAFSVARGMTHPRVMDWEDFLVRATDHAPAQYPETEELATIRYTSGTTGEPKGVTFTFGQLAWMGEVLTNLLPWQDRNRSMCYLSFLPLSHVVEGILASYAPYYLIAKVDYYYLNDFSALTKALPKVRPSVFFSVPRFYEKVWEQVRVNPLYQRWLDGKEGPGKAALGAVLRTAVLRKAGIDRCKQLIVGSAPVSEALLLNFRALGIEIHNAYGQTEAPLITINRLGDNVIPTIGTPLPETEVTLAPDGELLVRGPQVTRGYYGLVSGQIQDGVLHTGDLGVLHEDGHITLLGRKKDMVITAYGKNISIPKIEERLKDIPGVSEAVLIGEGRPYCTALLWLEGEVTDLEERIQAMNARLSHPEQIRHYRVISRPLRIQAGELTPNLKVKRGAVEARFRREIEEMYS